MEIEFSDRKLEKTLTDDRLLQRAYGTLSFNIKNRISELVAAASLDMIPVTPPPRRHKLENNLAGCWGINISKNYRLIIEPVGDYNPEDLKTITRIRIKAIDDYH